MGLAVLGLGLGQLQVHTVDICHQNIQHYCYYYYYYYTWNIQYCCCYQHCVYTGDTLPEWSNGGDSCILDVGLVEMNTSYNEVAVVVDLPWSHLLPEACRCCIYCFYCTHSSLVSVFPFSVYDYIPVSNPTSTLFVMKWLLQFFHMFKLNFSVRSK